MKKWLDKIEREFLTRKALGCLAVLGAILSIAPLLYIGRYNHGLGDDLRFPFHVHCAWLNTHSLWEVLKTAFSTVAEYYEKWQGTYSSIFFFAISPMAFGEQYVHVVPYMMIGMIWISTAVLVHAVLKRLFGMDGYACVAATMAAVVMQCIFMYTPASGLYYYNAAVHYVFMQGFFNLTAAFSLLYLERLYRGGGRKAGRIAELVLCTGAVFMAAGANFSTALLTMEVLLILEAAAILLWRIKRNVNYLWFTIPFLVGCAGFLANVLAPGNAVRQANYIQKGVLWTIGECFAYSFSQMCSWVDLYVIVILILLLPVLLKAGRDAAFSFRYPLLVTVMLYCLYASMFAPGFYALGYSPLSRNQNICKMFLLVGLVISEAYWCGWITRRCPGAARILVPAHGRNVLGWTGVLCAALLCGFVCFLRLDEVAKKATFVNYGAFRMTVEGEGIQYWHEYLQRLAVYREHIWSYETVYVEPYISRPYPLWVTETTEIPENDEGRIDGHVALWYGLEAIYERQ